MRPIYETDDDLQNELVVVKDLCSGLNCSYKKLPISYGLDYALIREEDVFAFIEIKCRKRHSQRHESLMVSAQKRVKAQDLSRATGVPCMLVSSFTDGVYWINFAEKPDKVTFNGRTDRGDAQDVEPVIHYATERLSLVLAGVTASGGG